MQGRNSLAAAVLLGLACQGAAAQEAAAGADKDAKTLDAVSVTGRFVEATTRSAMKVEASVLDTPYSTASYGDAFMKAVETASLADLYNYMTGVRRGGNTGYDLSIRGFKTTEADKGAILVNGLPGLAGRFGSPPTIAAESIEVVKGPASALYGQAQPGGFVNIITKKPRYDRQTTVDLRASSYAGSGIGFGDANGYSVGVDTTGHIDEDGKLLYRFIVETSDKDGFRTDSFDRGIYLAPSLSWNISDATSVTAALEHRERRNSYEINQLMAPDKDIRRVADIRTRYQEHDDFQKESADTATVSMEHWFGNGASWHFSGRNVRNDSYAEGFDNVKVLADLTTLQRRARRQLNKRSYNFFDTYLSIPFATGRVEHKMLVGMNGGVDTTDFDRVQFYNGPTSGQLAKPGPGSINVDIYHPVLGRVGPVTRYPLGSVNRRYTRSSSQGVYVSDLMTLSEHWKASFGLRYTREKQITEERKTPPLTRREKSISDVLPTLGLMYQPTDQWTIYASYATSYVPQGAAVQDSAGANEFDPQSAHQVELGTKVKLLDGRLGASFAVFDITKENTLAPIACNAGVGGSCSQQVGAERSKGAEIEVDYSITDNWQLLFGYAYSDAYIKKSNSAPTAPLVGSRLVNSARSSANLWTRYSVTEGALDGLGVGFGVNYSGSIAGELPTRADGRVLELPSYWLADLAFYYTIADRYDLTLKFGNLFDKRHYESAYSTGGDNGVVPGAPRNVTLSLRVPFK